MLWDKYSLYRVLHQGFLQLRLVLADLPSVTLRVTACHPPKVLGRGQERVLYWDPTAAELGRDYGSLRKAFEPIALRT